MKNNRKDLRKYIGESYQTYQRSYLFLLPYFHEFNILFKIDFNVFNVLIPFSRIFRFTKVSFVKEKLEIYEQRDLKLCVSACLSLYLSNIRMFVIYVCVCTYVFIYARMYMCLANLNLSLFA
jgi:hypothetical protein